MKTIEIVLSPTTLETIGDHSITGMIGNKCVENGIEKPEQIIIKFHSTTIEWRKTHGGPEHYIIPEYAIPAILKDVIHWIAYGVQIIIDESLVNPSETS